MGEVAWSGRVSDTSATTSLDYGEETVVTMPHARRGHPGLDCSLGTYATIDGEYSVCAAGTVTWSVPTVAPPRALDLSHFIADQRSAIAAALDDDVSTSPTCPSDSYFGGKALFRIANLLQIAKELGEDATAAALQAALAEALREWGDADRCSSGEARCFVYDPRIKGIVGVTPAFGSEDFNDHHFHYGYLLYAAAVAAAPIRQLAEEIGPVFDQVAADIASAQSTRTVPRHPRLRSRRRSLVGVGLLAVRGRQQPGVEFRGGVRVERASRSGARCAATPRSASAPRGCSSAEADAARRLWLEPDLSGFPEYDHDIVALEWGGKRDYATWFSAEPSAMLGIQLIPMAPIAAHYLRPSARSSAPRPSRRPRLRVLACSSATTCSCTARLAAPTRARRSGSPR